MVHRLIERVVSRLSRRDRQVAGSIPMEYIYINTLTPSCMKCEIAHLDTLLVEHGVGHCTTVGAAICQA